MTFCTGCFPPSEKFLPYLQAYLTKCAGPKASIRERKFAVVSQRRLAKIASIGSRTRPLSVSEIEATKVLPFSFSSSPLLLLSSILFYLPFVLDAQEGTDNDPSSNREGGVVEGREYKYSKCDVQTNVQEIASGLHCEVGLL